MFRLTQTHQSLLKCPQCQGKYAHIINFGKKAHCWNCRYVWDLVWRGGRLFSQEVKKHNV